MALYEKEIVWTCTCGESGRVALMYPDDEGSKLRLLLTTHRPARGCDLNAQVHQRAAPGCPPQNP
jgi:hypothetical protein